MNGRFADYSYLIELVFIREIFRFHIFYILPDCIGHDCIQISITAEKFRSESFVHTQHVGNDKYLSVDVMTGAYTDYGVIYRSNTSFLLEVK